VKRRTLLVGLAAVVLAGDRTEQALRRARTSRLSSSEQAALPARGRPVGINVKEHPFNATGNGITDDTAAFTSARDAAGAGGTVSVPPGTYVLNNLGLNVARQHWRIMDGATLLLRPASRGPIFTISGNDTTMDGGGVIDGNISQQIPAFHPCACVSAAHVTIQGLTFRNGNGYMLSFDGHVSGGSVLDCRFSNTYMQAIVFGNSLNDSDIIGIKITRNRIFNYQTSRAWSSGGIAVVGPPSYKARRIIISENAAEAWPFSPWRRGPTGQRLRRVAALR
jgi:hypothetical protein